MAEETEEPIAAKATPTRASRAKEWLGQRFEKYENLPFADVALAIYRRDRDSAGSVVGSAIAFRLFLFFVPLLLFVVGIAGFISGFVDAQGLNSTAGVSGTLAAQINSAFHTPNGTRWIATLLGLFGIVTAGRSLSKALVSASVVAWRLPTRPRTSFRAVGAIAGLVFGMALISVLVNRVRESLGLGAASVSFIFAFVVYAIAWLGISMWLPRGTDDPGALLPGSLVVALTVTAMHAVSELYLPDRLAHASQLYGGLGATIVTLGWFFIIGRSIALAMELNSVIYERFGTISRVVFALPAFRVLARRSRHIRQFFDLDPVPQGRRPTAGMEADSSTKEPPTAPRSGLGHES